MNVKRENIKFKSFENEFNEIINKNFDNEINMLYCFELKDLFMEQKIMIMGMKKSNKLIDLFGKYGIECTCEHVIHIDTIPEYFLDLVKRDLFDEEENEQKEIKFKKICACDKIYFSNDEVILN